MCELHVLTFIPQYNCIEIFYREKSILATSEQFFTQIMTNINSTSVKTRKMMGEYLIYYDDVLIGGLYDNQLLVKMTTQSRKIATNYPSVRPYPGAKPMIKVDVNSTNEALLSIFEVIADDLKTNKH